MNYYEWSNEYYRSAVEVNDRIEILKSRRKQIPKSAAKELDSQINEYKKMYNDCLHIANHLLDRHNGID